MQTVDEHKLSIRRRIARYSGHLIAALLLCYGAPSPNGLHRSTSRVKLLIE